MALNGLQKSSNSNCIWGKVPLALVLKVLSFKAHHFFSLFFMLSKGTQSFPGKEEVDSREIGRETNKVSTNATVLFLKTLVT